MTEEMKGLEKETENEKETGNGREKGNAIGKEKKKES